MQNILYCYRNSITETREIILFIKKISCTITGNHLFKNSKKKSGAWFREDLLEFLLGLNLSLNHETVLNK